ncbi:MAG: cytochrome c biogenesis factor-like protein [Sphingomonas sp.]
MGWLMLAALALGAALVLGAIGFPRRLWMVAATALTLGAAGYAFQGSPDLAGHPVTTAEVPVKVDPELIAMREAMFGRFNFSYTYFSAADAMTRMGAPDSAVKVMLGAVNKGPQDIGSWTGLGLTLADHDHGLSPAARFAFERAMALNPLHPRAAVLLRPRADPRRPVRRGAAILGARGGGNARDDQLPFRAGRAARAARPVPRRDPGAAGPRRRCGAAVRALTPIAA